MNTALISLLASLLVSPWIALTWWQVYRRCVSVGAAISLWLSVKVGEGRTFRSYGLGGVRAGKRQFLFGLTLGLGTVAVLLSIGLVIGVYRIVIVPDHWRIWRTVVGFLPVAVLVSLLEEIVFRGFILQQLQRCSTVLAVITSSALYAIVHVRIAEFTFSMGLELIGLFLLGAILCLSYLTTGQLYLSMGLHAALAYAARVNKLIFEFPDSYAAVAWLSGTSRLINGVMVWIGLLGMAGIVVWWARSSHRGGVRHENA